MAVVASRLRRLRPVGLPLHNSFPPALGAPLQLHQVPAPALAPLDTVRTVHSYVDELQRVAAEEAPTAVADIGDPGGRATAGWGAALPSLTWEAA